MVFSVAVMLAIVMIYWHGRTIGVVVMICCYGGNESCRSSDLVVLGDVFSSCDVTMVKNVAMVRAGGDPVV